MLTNKTITRRSLFALAVASQCGHAAAQTALRPIRVVVSFQAGGIADLVTRAFATPLAEALGTSIIVDNRPGAEGAIAADFVAKAPADGTVLFVATSTALSYLPAVRKSLPFDPVQDFTPIAEVGEFGFFLYTSPKLPAQSVAELVAYAKTQPEGLTHATTSATSLLTSTLFAKAQGVRLLQVPYRGDPQVTPDLIENRVQLAFSGGSQLPHAKSGALRVLMTTLPARSPLMPEAPTWVESGLPPLAMSSWMGLVGPSGLPEPLVRRISSALASVVSAPGTREALTKLAFQAQYADSAQFASLLQQQRPAWADAVRLAGMKTE